MKNYIFILLIFIVLGSVSCDGFLEEYSQNEVYVEYASDLEEILIGECYNRNRYYVMPFLISNASWGILTGNDIYFPWIHILDDDVTEFAVRVQTTASRSWIREQTINAHQWQPEPFMNYANVEVADKNWALTYKKIAVLNSIIFQMDEIRIKDSKNAKLCDQVEGEARFLRALYYFWLANVYGAPYCKTTAETDPCIPLKVTEYVESGYFERASARKVYDQIVADLKRAIICLEGVNHNKRLRADQSAANLLLSRTYLYMEEYEKAIECAEEVIGDSRYSLLDLNTHTLTNSFTYISSPETIFTQGSNGMGALHSIDQLYGLPSYAQANSYTTSEDLYESFGGNDLRLKTFFTESLYSKGTFRCIKWKGDEAEVVSDTWLMRLPEAYLNKAEAEACLGREDAKITIKLLLEKRFAAEDIPAIGETGADLVNFIRDERRRELCYEAHRWFDLRRYGVNTEFPFTKTIRHIHLEFDPSINATTGIYYVAGEYVLNPYPEDKAAYMLPIPRAAIEFNRGTLTNEQRPEREMHPY